MSLCPFDVIKVTPKMKGGINRAFWHHRQDGLYDLQRCLAGPVRHLNRLKGIEPRDTDGCSVKSAMTSDLGPKRSATLMKF